MIPRDIRPYIAGSGLSTWLQCVLEPTIEEPRFPRQWLIGRRFSAPCKAVTRFVTAKNGHGFPTLSQIVGCGSESLDPSGVESFGENTFEVPI